MTRFACSHIHALHILSNFDCGNSALNIWLVQHAQQMQQRRYSRVFVWTEVDAPRDVVGFFSLSATMVRREDLQSREARSELRQIPAFLLGKVALDRRLQGQGLAKILIADAIRIAAKASESVAARLLVVDAIDETAARIYQHCGFTPGPDSRLYARLDDLRAAAAEADLR